MNIVIMTNAFPPLVGGVAESVKRFVAAYRAEGHRVLVVAPTFEGHPEVEEDVIRIPAIQRFNGSDFSFVLPVPLFLWKAFNEFEPDVVHSQHPFLLGDTALRVSTAKRTPIVFTHHTLYEDYTHYVPFGAARMRDFVKRMCTLYANRCTRVIAPSTSIKNLLEQRGVTRPIHVVPSGVDIDAFSRGNGRDFREAHRIDPEAFVIGYVGRLAPEKNLAFLAEAAARFMRARDDAILLIVGAGPSSEQIEQTAREHDVGRRVVFTGALQDQHLIDAYHALDGFVFCSKTETQGMVLVEAMAASKPVVALDGPGVRDVLNDGVNGRLIREEDPDAFSRTLAWFADLSHAKREVFARNARKTSKEYSVARCAEKAIEVYHKALAGHEDRAVEDDVTDFEALLHSIEAEWRLWADRIHAAIETISAGEETEDASSPQT